MYKINDYEVINCDRKYYVGRLILKEHGNYPSYGIFNCKYGTPVFHDVDELLDWQYKKGNAIVYVKLKVKNRKVFEQVGRLYKDKRFGAWEWFIGNDIYYNGKCLGDVLFENVGEEVCLVVGVV